MSGPVKNEAMYLHNLTFKCEYERYDREPWLSGDHFITADDIAYEGHPYVYAFGWTNTRPVNAAKQDFIFGPFQSSVCMHGLPSFTEPIVTLAVSGQTNLTLQFLLLEVCDYFQFKRCGFDGNAVSSGFQPNTHIVKGIWEFVAREGEDVYFRLNITLVQYAVIYAYDGPVHFKQLLMTEEQWAMVTILPGHFIIIRAEIFLAVCNDPGPGKTITYFIYGGGLDTDPS